MLIYRAEMYILVKYPYLIDIGVKYNILVKIRNEGLYKKFDEKSQYFIIKSFSEEDVHKVKQQV